MLSICGVYQFIAESLRHEVPDVSCFLSLSKAVLPHRMLASPAISRVAQCLLFSLPMDSPVPFRYLSPSTDAFPAAVCSSHYLFVAGSVTDTWQSWERHGETRNCKSQPDGVILLDAVTAVPPDIAGLVTFWSSCLIATQWKGPATQNAVCRSGLRSLSAAECYILSRLF